MTQWIRVSDACPDTCTPVLVTFDNGKERIAQSVAILDEAGDWRWWRFEDDDYKQNPKVADYISVVAWQPLPRPCCAPDCENSKVEAITTFVYLTLPTLTPIGESGHDARVDKHIEQLGAVVYDLTDRLCQIARGYKDSIWPSARQCASTAQDYINDISELLEEE